jgi:hypothetical protein
VKARFSAPVLTGRGGHPASCTMGTGSFLGVKSDRDVTLTPHLLLVPRSKNRVTFTYLTTTTTLWHDSSISGPSLLCFCTPLIFRSQANLFHPTVPSIFVASLVSASIRPPFVFLYWKTIIYFSSKVFLGVTYALFSNADKIVL